MIYCRATVVLLCVVLFSGADWTRFRGPDGSGTAEEDRLPTTWSAEENIAWMTALPGFGASSPITLGKRIFLTCYSGYGLNQDEPGRQEDLRLHVLCLDRTRGTVLWDQTVQPKLPENPYGGMLALHGYASATVATDGQAVYAFFGRSGVHAFSLDGKPLWHSDVGGNRHPWGSAASPIAAKGLVIVNACVESGKNVSWWVENGKIVALDAGSGTERWHVDGVDLSWSTPLLVDVPGSGPELVAAMKGQVLGIDPVTGKELWRVRKGPDYICPSPIAHGGIVYVTGGRQEPITLAIRAGGRGDVTASHVLWENKKTARVGTPVYHDGHLYWVDYSGVAACIKADTGEEVSRQNLRVRGEGDRVYASPVVAGGKLYVVTREDGAIVLKATPRLEELARNRLDAPSIFNATPTIGEGTLLLRSNRFLYCIGH